VNLLPGTLSVELQDERLLVHVLDGDAPILDALQALEDAVAALFDIVVNASAAKGEPFRA
jgi:hypothetical protein